MGRSITGLLVILVAHLSCTLNVQATGSQTSGTCSCEYIEQPPNELQCNPYQNLEFVLECTILFPVSQTDKSIVWFRSQLQSPTQEAKETGSDSDLDLWQIDRLSEMQPGVQIREQSMQTQDGQNIWKRSQLAISDLNDSYVGDYWCRIKDGNDWLIPSDSVYLQQASTYSHFGACSQEFAQSKQERKCAGWIATVTPPENATTESSVLTEGTTVQPLTKEEISSAHPSTEEDIFSITAHAQTVAVSNVTDDEDLDDEARARSLATEFYIAISILVLFGVMVLIFAPATLYMCIKRRKQGRHRRPDLERIRPVNLERRSATMPAVASDYLVPRPFLGLTQEQLQLQASRMQRPHSARHSCETILGLNHDYEDVGSAVSQHSSSPDYSNVSSSTLTLKRNEAYRACENGSERRKEKVRVEILDGPSTRDMVIPNPLYVQTSSGEERFSDDSGEYVDPTGSSYL